MINKRELLQSIKRITEAVVLIIGIYFLINVINNIQTKYKLRQEPVETINLELSYLWDPYDENLEDGKILNRPMYMTAGPENELIIADTENSRIVRMTKTGDVIEIIGRRGEGPGEFLYPTDVQYSDDTKLIWILETRARKITKYLINGNQSEFYCTLKLPSTVHPPSGIHPPPGFGFVINPDQSITLHSQVGTKLLYRINEEGIIVSSYGELWNPYDINLNPITAGRSLQIENLIYIMPANDNIAIIWSSRPTIQLWNETGGLIEEHDIWNDEIKFIKNLKIPDNAIPTYITAATIDNRNNRIYCYTWVSEEYLIIHGYNSITLKPIKRYVCETKELVYLNSLVVYNDDNNIEIYGLGLLLGVVVKMKQSKTS